MITFRSIKLVTLSAITLSLLTSCATELSQDTYSADIIGEPAVTYAGVIRSARCVNFKENDRLEENGLGMITGGVVGGVTGNTIGKGTGNTFATLGGVIAGATAGALAEQKMKEQKAMEYVVQIDNGGLVTVVQGINPALCVGQPVYVMVPQCGRSRIVAQ